MFIVWRERTAMGEAEREKEQTGEINFSEDFQGQMTRAVMAVWPFASG